MINQPEPIIATAVTLEPGNGTRYVIIHGYTPDGEPFVALPAFGKAAIMGLHPAEHTYIMEKLQIGETDAKIVLAHLTAVGQPTA